MADWDKDTIIFEKPQIGYPGMNDLGEEISVYDEKIESRQDRGEIKLLKKPRSRCNRILLISAKKLTL